MRRDKQTINQQLPSEKRPVEFSVFDTYSHHIYVLQTSINLETVEPAEPGKTAKFTVVLSVTSSYPDGGASKVSYLMFLI